MTKVEDLKGILGVFKGETKRHPDTKFRYRSVAYGTIFFGEAFKIPVKGVRVRILHKPNPPDFRQYVRIERGPKRKRDKFIGIIDQN